MSSSSSSNSKIHRSSFEEENNPNELTTSLLSDDSHSYNSKTTSDSIALKFNSQHTNFPKFKFDALTNKSIFGYGLGHFINDLIAAGWFNYLMIYLKSINPIYSKNAGFYAGY